jgi:5,5'-dehydrodivanillate O-demethylase
MFTFRDEAANRRIDLPNERKKHHNSDGARSWIMRTHAAYSPIAEDVIRMYESVKPEPAPLRAVS